jgi:hypothetical protein
MAVLAFFPGDEKPVANHFVFAGTRVKNLYIARD